jgi:DNA-binding Xre family transcriptional regulator
MNQIDQIVAVLKQQLKAHSKTYADVAEALSLSEASVKRLFSQKDLSLQRIDEICRLMDLEILDVMRLARRVRPMVAELTLEQERDIVEDEKLMLILICVLSHWRFEDILYYYDLQKAECIQKLVILDQLGIIELLPNNIIRLQIASNFDWVPNGPVQHFFQQHMQSDFMNSRFHSNDELFICKSGMLTPEANRLLQREMRKLADKFLEYNNEEIAKPLSERDGSALLIALRPWAPRIFDKYKKV